LSRALPLTLIYTNGGLRGEQCALREGERANRQWGSTNDTEKVIPYFADPRAVLPDGDTLERG
jgi:hypothetical protein